LVRGKDQRGERGGKRPSNGAFEQGRGRRPSVAQKGGGEELESRKTNARRKCRQLWTRKKVTIGSSTVLEKKNSAGQT